MVRDIRTVLKDKFDVYFPGQKQGKCQSEYIVLKDDGQAGLSKEHAQRMIDVIIFVPQQKYSSITGLSESVKKEMDAIEAVQVTGNETPVIFDDSVSGWTSSIEYIVLIAR